jgi:hypothetical protein
LIESVRGRQTGRQADRQTGWLADRQTDMKACRQTGRQTDRDRQTNRQAGRQTDMKACRQAGKQTDRHRQTDRTVISTHLRVVPTHDNPRTYKKTNTNFSIVVEELLYTPLTVINIF